MSFCCVTIYGQEAKVPYDELIASVKKSGELIDFTKKHNIDKLNFQVKKDLYPLCENFNMFNKNNLTQRILDFCNNSDWLSSELKKEAGLKGKCDKGKKTLRLYFTETIDNLIIAEVVIKGIEQESLLFLYKIENNEVLKIESNHIFKD